MSSLRRGHANLLCIVPIFTDDAEAFQGRKPERPKGKRRGTQASLWSTQRLPCGIRLWLVPGSNNRMILVGVVGNISACHADAPGSIPGRGAFLASRSSILVRLRLVTESARCHRLALHHCVRGYGLMARRRIPDPKTGGSSPSSLILQIPPGARVRVAWVDADPPWVDLGLYPSI